MAEASGRAVHILVVGKEPTLPGEFDAAVAGIRSRRVQPQHVTDHRQGVEMARLRAPDVICVEMTRELAPLKTFARDVLAVAPRAAVAAIYRPEDFGPNDLEGRILIDAMRAGIRDFLRRPLSSTELQQLLDRSLVRTTVAETALGRVASFLSNRGGVGKSTLAVNTATALAERHPGRVLLVDAAFQAGVCATILDLVPTTSIVDVARERDRIDETMLRELTTAHDSGLRLLAAPDSTIDAAELTDETLTRVLGLARRTFDYVVVDTFPMLDSVLLTILDLTDVAYVVVQGTVPGVTRAEALLRVLDLLSYDKSRQRLVLSRNYPSFAGDLRTRDVEASLDREIAHELRYDRRVLRSLNRGAPHIRACARWRGFARSIMEIVRELEVAPVGTRPPVTSGLGPWLGRLWGRGEP